MRQNRTSSGRGAARGLLRLMLLIGVIGLGGAGLAAGAAHAQIPGALNVSLSPPSQTIQVGQAATFSYTASPPAVAPPFPTITNLSISWGDGSVQQLPVSGTPGPVSGSTSHVYASSGTFLVTLTATDSNGRSGQASAQVIAGGSNQPPLVSLSASPNQVQAGQVVTFTYSVSPRQPSPPGPSLRSLVLNFGNGNSTQVTPPSGSQTFTYQTPGNYTATLTATDTSGQTGTASAPVVVTAPTQPPQVQASVAPSSAQVGQQVTLSYSATSAFGIGFTSIRSVLINWGDGAPQPATPPSGTATHTYTTPGTYTIQVTAQDSSGQVGQAQTSVSITAAQPPSVNLSTATTSSPAGQSVTFNYTATTAPGAPGLSGLTIDFGDGSTQALTAQSGTVTHVYAAPGTYTATLMATDQSGQGGRSTAAVQITQPVVSGQPLGNVAIVNAPASGTVGQGITLTAATATTSNTGAQITSYSWSFCNGGTATGQTVTFVVTTPGPCVVTLTVTDSTGVSGNASATITVIPTGISVTYQPGWNLIALPPGAYIPGPLGPLYTFQAGNTDYQVAQNGQSGLGYWAYFSTPTTAVLPLTLPDSVTLQLPAGQFIMVGNPSSKTATVSGADIVYTYSPTDGYQATTTLQPGQGAWVFSYNGGTVTITSGQ